MHSRAGRRVVAQTALGVATLLSACEDKRVKAVEKGITRDSLLTVIGKDAPGVDSLPNVYARERYLIDGKNYEIMLFSPTGKHNYLGNQKDSIPRKELTPIAMIDNVVVGKGWEFLDSLYRANHIPIVPRERR